MSEVESPLMTEVESLRQQLEAYRQRELTSLQEQLAAAKADAAHYRAEAERNADLGRRIHLEAQAEINRLRERVQTLERIPNARPAPGG